MVEFLLGLLLEFFLPVVQLVDYWRKDFLLDGLFYFSWLGFYQFGNLIMICGLLSFKLLDCLANYLEALFLLLGYFIKIVGLVSFFLQIIGFVYFLF
jgi:hypothetical protein